MRTRLLDTGPLIAFLDTGDPAHKKVVRILASLNGGLVTTGAVLTEAFHMLRYAPAGAERLVEFLETTNVRVLEIFTLDYLRRMARLMAKYADQPMDFADASLVLAAEETGHDEVLTLDERDFRSFRFRGNRRFRLVIQDGEGAGSEI